MPARLLPVAGPARTLALAQLANSIGDGAFLVTSALYFTQVVGLSPGQVGLGLSLAWAAGLLAGVPAGHAADRRDARTVVNTAAVMLAQVRMARRVVDPPAAVRSLRRAGAAMVVACGLFALSAAASAPWAAAAILLLGAGAQVYAEMAHGAGAWQLSFDLAPAGRHGLYQGFFGSGVPVARMLGPVLLTWLIVDGGAVGWLAFAALYATAAAGTGLVVRGSAPLPAARPALLVPGGPPSATAPSGWARDTV
ncbi:hypothetical protein ONA70_18355 [Micromonospora yasonensis]|uniref:hypothetical protein n=1 Tax=Micromonospora yasonensis TaxID=1128667 RepID=UPI002230A387|nr:hypothetical protein [Micromonospora yasonensis]MCW3842064.1 hypothetical protein [Micromonospora yasonensis]